MPLAALHLAILTTCLAAQVSNRPWEVRRNLLQPVDSGRADVNSLATSNFVPSVDLRVPTRFEQVYRLSDVLRQGAPGIFPRTWRGDRTVSCGFSGGVAAVFNFSRYTATARGRVSEIPEGTVFRLDLRPPAPGDVMYSRPAAPSYNAVSLNARGPMRDLAAANFAGPRDGGALSNLTENAVAVPPPPPRSLWTDELFRGRTVADLLDRAAYSRR